MIALFTVSLSMLAFPGSDSLDWKNSFAEALIVAEANQRPVFMLFSGSDWCRECMRFEAEVLDSRLFREYAAEYLNLVQIDFPRGSRNAISPERGEENATLASAYNPQGSFPYIVVLSPGGVVIGSTEYLGEGPLKFIGRIKVSLDEHSRQP